MSNRKPIFDEIKRARDGAAFTDEAVRQIDGLLDLLGVPRPNASRTIGPKGIAIIKRWEGCHKKLPDGRVQAYPDPGTGNLPITIGWGTTRGFDGKPIPRGTIMSQTEVDMLLERDLVKYALDVAKALGDAPTTQEQFDALVSFHYNTGAIAKATLTKIHRGRDYSRAAKEFARWNRAGGRVLPGLTNRRADEAALYRSNTP